MEIKEIQSILKLIPLNFPICLEDVQEIYKWQTQKQKI